MIITGPEGYLPVQKKTARRVSPAAEQDGRSFREAVANLSYQVRPHNTPGKIQELRRQVSAGEYQVEPRETAARMLLLMEEGE